MRYVVDSSVAFKWVVQEHDSDRAVRLRDDYRNGIHELLAPDIFPAEVANALLVAERRGRINPGQFPIFLADILTTPPIMTLTRLLLTRVTTLVVQVQISTYDALYVALAERENCEFVTADDKLVRKLPAFPFVISLSTFP